MKKKYGLFICGSLLLTLGSYLTYNSIKKPNEFFEKGQSGFQENGPKLILGNGEDLGESENVSPTIKVQVSDVNESNQRSIRFIAAISTLNVNASFKRTMYDKTTSTVTKEEETFKVTTAYSYLQDGEEILYPNEYGEQYHYFITYTMNNIPEENWLDVLNVTVKVDSLSKNIKANVAGSLISNLSLDQNLTYEALSDGTYEVKPASTSITSAHISSYYGEMQEPNVASSFGKVSSIANRAFDGCSSLVDLVIPDTLEKFGNQAFRNCSSLVELTLPTSLKNGGDDLCYYGLTSLKTIYYNAAEMTGSFTYGIEAEIDDIYFSKSVKKIPSGFFRDNFKVKNMHYEGSKEEWADVDKGSTNYCFDDGIVICQDTLEVTINFHFEGYSLTVDETQYEDLYTLKAYEGEKINIPQLDNTLDKFFSGWYSTETFDEDSKLTSKQLTLDGSSQELNYYAKFEEMNTNGLTVESALSLTPGMTSEVIHLTNESPCAYFIYTPEKTDYYYFKDIYKESTFDSKVFLQDVTDYMSEGKITTSQYNAISSDVKDKIYNDDGNGNSKCGLGYLLEKDHTYIYRIQKYNLSGNIEGDVKVNFFTQDGDREEEAEVINYLEEKDSAIHAPGTSRYYSFTSSENKVARVEVTSTLALSNCKISISKDGSEIKSVNLTSSTTSSHIDMEFEANQTYLISVANTSSYSSSAITTDGKGEFKISIGEVPAGETPENGIPFYDDEEHLGQDIQVDWAKGSTIQYYTSSSGYDKITFSDVYYSFKPTKNVSYRFETTGISTSSSKFMVQITQGVSTIASTGSLYKRSSSYGSSSNDYYISPAYNDISKIINFEADKEYVIRFLGQVNGSVCTQNVTFKFTELESTSSLESPHELIGDGYKTTSTSEIVNFQETGINGYGVTEYFKITIANLDCNYIDLRSDADIEIYSLETSSPVSIFSGRTSNGTLTGDFKLEVGKTYIIAIKNYSADEGIRIRFKNSQ